MEMKIYYGLVAFLVVLIAFISGCTIPQRNSHITREEREQDLADIRALYKETKIKQKESVEIIGKAPSDTHKTSELDKPIRNKTFTRKRANKSQIRTALQAMAYRVHKVDFKKDKLGKYCVSVYIDTKGDYDKESLAMHRIMFNNAIADYYFAMIVDYELKASWSFRASRQTLSDYFSGKISEQEYIHQIKTEKIM
jgi:hypothetical protein